MYVNNPTTIEDIVQVFSNSLECVEDFKIAFVFFKGRITANFIETNDDDDDDGSPNNNSDIYNYHNTISLLYDSGNQDAEIRHNQYIQMLWSNAKVSI